jgi:hypothetical protein
MGQGIELAGWNVTQGNRFYNINSALQYISLQVLYQLYLCWDKWHHGQFINNDDNMAYVMTYRKDVGV